MTGDDTNPLQSAIDREFPLLDGVCLLADRIDEQPHALFPVEREAVARAIDRRRNEFAAGRRLARSAMQELGFEPGPIPRGDARQPVWPDGIQGSITHAEDWAAACVGSRRTVRAVGIDLEVAHRVGEELHGKLFTPRERDVLACLESWAPGLFFSAKEAGYKATYPLAGRFIGFKEAEVEVDVSAGRFRLRYVGDHLPNKVMELAEGYFLRCDRFVLSLVLIPVNR